MYEGERNALPRLLKPQQFFFIYIVDNTFTLTHVRIIMADQQYSSSQGNQFSEFIGTVLEDKESFSRVIKVHLKEMLPFVQGEVKAIEDTKKIESASDGFTGTITTTNMVEAKWIGFSNRRYPPDVRKNEQVRVWKYADSDDYYWDSMGRDDNLRGPERLNFSVSGEPGPVDTLNDDNTYFVELDSRHKKRAIIRTSKKNGEKYAYLFCLDAINNRVTLCDDSNNEIRIESDTPRVLMRNRNGTIVDLCMKNLSMVAPEDATLKAGRQFTVDTPVVTFVNESGDGTMHWKAHDVHLDADKSFVATSPSIGLNGAVRADTIVATQVQSTGYSTGDPGSAYTGATTDIEDGSGSKPNNPPNAGGGDASNRHCAAWEEVSAALRIIADCLTNTLGACPEVSAVYELADKCQMRKNRGE